MVTVVLDDAGRCFFSLVHEMDGKLYGTGGYRSDENEAWGENLNLTMRDFVCEHYGKGGIEPDEENLKFICPNEKSTWTMVPHIPLTMLENTGHRYDGT